MNSKYLDGELGLLKIKVLAVHIPQKLVARKVSDVGYDSDDDDEMLMKPVTKVIPIRYSFKESRLGCIT